MKIKIKALKNIKESDGNDELKTKIIHAFINAQEGSDQSELKNILSGLVKNPCEAITYLNQDEISPKLYTKAVEIHNSFCKNQIKVDAFGNFPKIGHDPYQVPGSNKNVEPGRNFLQELKKLVINEVQNYFDSSSFILNKLRFLVNNEQEFIKQIESYENHGTVSDLVDSLKELVINNKLSKISAEKMFNMIMSYRRKKDDELMAADTENHPESETKDDPHIVQKMTGKPDLRLVEKERIINFGIGKILKR